MRAWLIVCCFVFSFAAQANEMVVHIIGDGQSRAIAKTFFPDAAVLPSPGANGVFVWKKLENNTADVAVQVPLVTHYFALTGDKEDPAQQYEMLATVARITQVLMARPELPVNNIADIKKLQRTVTVGWGGSACESIVKKAFAPHGIDFIYLPYKTFNDAMAAFMGGHIDFICPAGATLRQATQNNIGKVVFDFKDYYGTQHITLFVNRGMSDTVKQKIIQQITRKLTAEDVATAENAGFVWSVHTGKAAKDIFDRERQAWQKVLK
jgi:tripartite-type tricarboxylate transporter receptor subunit TctC